MILIDNTVRRVPLARIAVDCPYLCGEVEALSLPNPVCDLIVGNVEGARGADDPDINWQVAGTVTTRQPSKKNLHGRYKPKRVSSSSPTSNETPQRYRELGHGTRKEVYQKTPGRFEEEGINWDVLHYRQSDVYRPKDCTNRENKESNTHKQYTTYDTWERTIALG
jgi:hypothetical protein